MSASYVDADGKVTQLDGRAPSRVTIAARDVQDPEKLAQLLQDHEDRLAAIERAWSPRRLFRRDLSVDGTGTTKYRIEHGFGGRVNWYVVRWASSVGGGTAWALEEHSDTDANALVVVSAVAGTVTILAEAAG